VGILARYRSKDGSAAALSPLPSLADQRVF
jgi:hypothetical protein